VERPTAATAATTTVVVIVVIVVVITGAAPVVVVVVAAVVAAVLTPRPLSVAVVSAAVQVAPPKQYLVEGRRGGPRQK
jgi:hypothetical protein